MFLDLGLGQARKMGFWVGCSLHENTVYVFNSWVGWVVSRLCVVWDLFGWYGPVGIRNLYYVVR